MKYFGKEWYNGQCKSGKEQYEYLDYEKSTLPKWYNDFSFHDCLILNMYATDDMYNIFYCCGRFYTGKGNLEKKY